MTDDIRERAFGFARKNADNWFEEDIDNLASLLASERAAALGAAAVVPEKQAHNLEDVVRSNVVGADQVDQLWIDRMREEHEELLKMSDAIRSLSPEGWVGVREADLAGLVDAARGAVSAAELIDRDRATDAGFLLALRMADALRAALARMP